MPDGTEPSTTDETTSQATEAQTQQSPVAETQGQNKEAQGTVENDEYVHESGVKADPEAMIQAKAELDRLMGRPTPKDRGVTKRPEPEKEQAPRDEKTKNETPREDTNIEKRVRDAFQALSRAKIPESVLESMTRDQLLAWGESVKKVQDEQAHEWRQHNTQEGDAGKAAQPDRTPAPEGAQRPTEPGPTEIDRYFETLTDQLGEEATRPLRSLFDQQKSQIESLTGNLNHISEQMKIERHQAALQWLDNQFEQASSALIENGALPELKDSGTRGRVFDTAKYLLSAPGSRYINAKGDLDTKRLVREAASIELSTETIKQTQDRILQRFLSESTGQPSSMAATKAPPKSMSPRDQHKEALRLLRSGMSAEEVRSRINSVSTLE